MLETHVSRKIEEEGKVYRNKKLNLHFFPILSFTFTFHPKLEIEIGSL